MSAPPRTMRAAVMVDVSDIRIETRDVPRLEPGDLLVRTAASGVCSGDLMPWYVRRKAPFVFGHEPAGTVVAAGDVTEGEPPPFALGDRIFAHHHAPCLRCEACARGAFVHCATWRGSALEPGGMAEYFRVPRANLVDALRLPREIDVADGSLVEPLACVVKSLRRAFAVRSEPALAPLGAAATWARAMHTVPPDVVRPEPRPPLGPGLTGRTLFVIGAGVMGLMHVAVAAAAGARVVASDFNAARRALAVALGAEAAVAPEDAEPEIRARFGDGTEVVVCGPGAPGVMASALRSVAADGTLLLFTPIAPEERFVFDQSAAYFRDLRLVASYSCGPDETREALRLIVAGVVTGARLRVTEFAFPAVADAYRAMATAEVVKAVVRFPD